MHILIAQFGYTISEADLRATADQLAPSFADIPGCLEKTWLIDAKSSTAGGVYKFRDGESLHAYLASALWQGVKSTPQFTNVTTSVFGVLEGPSEVTRSIPGALIAR